MAVNALLAKAMSTSSEEEAIACLRKARKKNGGATFEYKGDTPVLLREFEEKIGMPAVELYRRALDWQKYGKECSEKISTLKSELAHSTKNTAYWKQKYKTLEAKTNTTFWKTSFLVLLAMNCLALILVIT